MPSIDVRAEFVVTPMEILDERVSGTDHPCRAQPFQTAASTVAGLSDAHDRLRRGCIPLGDMACGRYQLDHARIRGSLIGGRFARSWAVFEVVGVIDVDTTLGHQLLHVIRRVRSAGITAPPR